MKKFSLILILLISTVLSDGMVVFMNYSVFKNDLNSSIIEVYLKIPLNTLYFEQAGDNRFQASVNYEVRILQNDSVFFQKIYNLSSPVLEDTLHLNFALLDLKRIELPQGIYRLEIQLIDVINDKNTASAAAIIDTKFPDKQAVFSDIELLDTVYQSAKEPGKFTRLGYELIPNVFNSFTSHQNQLYFYTELYSIPETFNGKMIFFRYYISKDSVAIDMTEKVNKQVAGQTNFLIGSLNISILPEGNYELVIEAYSKENLLLTSKKTAFSKRKTHDYYLGLTSETNRIHFAGLIKEYSTEELKKNISYLEIIGDNKEIQQVKLMQKEIDRAELESFFFEFWVRRDSLNPESAWINYFSRISDCNRQFTTMMREGYLTDRGRVYLEYGPPNSISESSSSQLAYPYQIWHYYQLTKSQQNKKFVFFNRTGALNEYELIHSNALGEPQNPKWREIISKYNNLNPNNDRFFGDFLDEDFNE
ncbi:MAG: GWxTD domain-containing protein [Sphingobacteriales bacterium]|nr:GWxTD domain-containing protein [Sphingobacteriales bacterium]